MLDAAHVVDLKVIVFLPVTQGQEQCGREDSVEMLYSELIRNLVFTWKSDSCSSFPHILNLALAFPLAAHWKR